MIDEALGTIMMHILYVSLIFFFGFGTGMLSVTASLKKWFNKRLDQFYADKNTNQSLNQRLDQIYDDKNINHKENEE